MSRLWGQGQLLDRLESGAFASSRCPRPREARPFQPHPARKPAPMAIYSFRRQSTRLTARVASLGTDFEISETGPLKLQPADYSFYHRMKESDITEQFLWDHRLAPVLSYLPPDQIRRVREALSLAFDAHSTQRRKSGEPFITHPVEVTRILGELRMDHESLEAGLLHDTVEDCGEIVGLEEIGFHFGPAVQRIVEGETKFSKLPTHHPEREGGGGGAAEPSAAEADVKAQDLQFLFLAMTEEVRIIVVKLADRLHNMRTMASMPPGKQRRIAQETLSVFAPLARLLGLYTIKEELEELSFMFAMPQQYAQMRKSVDRLWDQQFPAVQAAGAELQSFLAEDAFLAQRLRGLRVEVTKKALYSLWRKLQDASKSVRDVSEISQLRVVLDTGAAAGDAGAFAVDRQLCYHVMGLVHSRWAPIPGTMKDYIATPKPNNYQSLHTTVVPTGLTLPSSNGSNGSGSGAASNGASYKTNGAALANGNGAVAAKPRAAGVNPSGPPTLFPIEVQIRTQEMERLAQYGIAVESWSCADYARSATAQGGGAAGESTAGSSVDSEAGEREDGRRARAAAGQNGSSNGAGNGALSWLGLGNLLSRSSSAWSWSSSGEELPAATTSTSLSNGSSSSSNGSSNGTGSLANGAATAAAAAAAANGRGSSTTAAAALKGHLDPQLMSRRINWLNSIRQWQQEFVGTLTAQEFVACVTDDLLGQGVFVFTPSGEVMRLPKGATVVDFAYHIHSDVGNTMVAARVNGKVVAPDHELANAEVVEVITYRGPPNSSVIRRHQLWLGAARTKTARHKLAKFLREHAALAASVGLLAPGDSALGEAQRGTGPGSAVGDFASSQVVWLLARCDDRQGLLADIANAISRHGHNIRSYSGSTDVEAGVFVMEYELEGPPAMLRALCDDLSSISCVRGWEVGCALPSAPRKPPLI